MPLAGLIDLKGARVRWRDLDIHDFTRFGCSPATLAYLAELQGEREDASTDVLTASQIDKGTRQILLEATTEYFQRPTDMLAGMMGTLKHSLINKDHDGLIVEKRLRLKDLPDVSGKLDHYTLVSKVLFDLKAVGLFKVKKLLQDPWGEGGGYAKQLNFGAHALMEQGHEVKGLVLECIPRDVTNQNSNDLVAYGVTDPRIVLIPVSLRGKEQVIEWYGTKAEEIRSAKKNGEADLCSKEERWERWNKEARGLVSMRCRSYCPVSAACIAMSAARNEAHPLDGTTRNEEDVA